MAIRYSVKVKPLKDKAKADGTWPIYYLIRIAGRFTRASAKQNVDPKDWDFIKGRPIISSKNGHYLTKYLTDKMDGFNEFMLKRKASKEPITLTIAKSYFDNNTSLELYTFYEQQVNLWEQDGYATSTIKSYRSVLKILKEYNPKLTFGDLSLTTIKNFNSYLIKKRGNSLNGCSVKHKNLKSILTQAKAEGLIDFNPYSIYTIKKTLGNRKFLVIDEVMHLRDFTLPKENSTLRLVRDLFLFSCYTGLRYSDVMNLKANNIQLVDGKYQLNLIIVKTKSELEVPLSTDALDILNCYNSNYATDASTLIFPRLANPTINRGLKDLMKIVGIEKWISFHCARHTFASNHVEIGTALIHLKALLGHKSVVQTELYAKPTSKDLFVSSAKMSEIYKTRKIL